MHTSMQSVLYHCTSLISISIYRGDYEAQPSLCAAFGGRRSSSLTTGDRITPTVGRSTEETNINQWKTNKQTETTMKTHTEQW